MKVVLQPGDTLTIAFDTSDDDGEMLVAYGSVIPEHITVHVAALEPDMPPRLVYSEDYSDQGDAYEDEDDEASGGQRH